MATVDILRIDLYTGEFALFKAGAAPTFLLRGRTVQRMEAVSFPVGILKNVNLERQVGKLSAGDLVLTVSDGVTATGTEWIEAELELHAADTPRELAARIAREAKRRRIDGRSDDITVVAVRMEEG